MPILDVEVVGSIAAEVRNGLARRLADVAGEVLHSRPQGTWVKVRYLDAADYAENAGGPPEGVLPVFVRVLKGTVSGGEALAQEIDALAEAVADLCGRPKENVHIVYEPPAVGRIAFGGRLARSQPSTAPAATAKRSPEPMG